MTATKTEYTIFDRRTGQKISSSCHPDVSAKSENAAIRESGIEPAYAEIETRELSADECRPWVGN